jgi:WD40 repeat protein
MKNCIQVWFLLLVMGMTLPPAAQADITITLLRAFQSDCPVTAVRLSPDGKRLVAGGGELNEPSPIRRLSVWDVRTGKLAWADKASREITSVSISPDGRIVAGASGTNKVALWDMRTGRLERLLTCRGESVSTVAFSPDGRLLACAGHAVVFWSMPSHRWVRALHHPHANRDLGPITFSPDGKTLAAGYSFDVADDAGSSEVLLWETASGRVRRRLRERTDTITALAFRPDGKVLAVGLGTPEDAETDGSIRLWDVASGRPLRALTARDGDYDLETLCFSPDGTLLVSGSSTDVYAESPTLGKVRVWDTRTGRQKALLRGHRDLVTAVVFSADGAMIASGSDDGTVRLWRVH